MSVPELAILLCGALGQIAYLVPVHIPAMADADNADDELVIFNGIDNPVVPLSEAVAFLS